MTSASKTLLTYSMMCIESMYDVCPKPYNTNSLLKRCEQDMLKSEVLSVTFFQHITHLHCIKQEV